VYQLTAVDTATRWAIVAIVLGTPDGTVTARFVEAVVRRWRRFGFGVRAVLTDNGPEYIAAGFRAALAAKGITHVRIPPRSPNHNAVCERFQGTALQECWRPAFHRRRYTGTRQLQAEADAWLVRYNTRRRTTATSCVAARHAKSSTATSPSEQHDHLPQAITVTSTPGPEGLVPRQATFARFTSSSNC
jgi:transposase InsO family protein